MHCKRNLVLHYLFGHLYSQLVKFYNTICNSTQYSTLPMTFRYIRKFDNFRLPEKIISHLTLHRLISIAKDSVSLSKFKFFNILQGTCSLTCNNESKFI